MAETVLHRAEAYAAALPPLLIEASRIAETVLQGTHGRRKVGLGESFWQFRPYEPGYPASRIDWRQSARTQKLYVRETEWEAAQSLWLWRDGTASMDYRSAPGLPTKRDYAGLLLLALANLALRGGERAGILTAIPSLPSTSQAGFARLGRLLEADAGSGDLPPPHELKRFSNIMLFGDFLGPLPDIATAVERLAGQETSGLLIQVLDPAEIDLPFAGRVRFEGLESETPELAPRAEALRAEYKERLATQQGGLERIAAKAGWRIVLARTDRPALESLIELYTALAGGR